MSNLIIQTTNLTKTYGKTNVVDHLNLTMQQGDIYGFLGPNGAGKTTTIRMLLGLIKPSKGGIEILGKSLAKHKLEILRNTGSLVEYPSYYGHLTATQNLEAIRLILDVPKSRIDEVLTIVGLTKEANRPVKGFSLGMKQRLGIAASLLGQPKLLILDEPTNGLDPMGIHEIRELIKELPKKYGITILISSHLLSEVEQMANVVGIISKGKMVFQNTLEELKKQSISEMKFVVSESEDALWLARDLGFVGTLQNNVLSFSHMQDDQVARLVTHLVEHRHQIYRVEQARQSLEDIFMDLVGKENL
jgi:ABC-2 type transport system ATP-binding protein